MHIGKEYISRSIVLYRLITGDGVLKDLMISHISFCDSYVMMTVFSYEYSKADIWGISILINFIKHRMKYNLSAVFFVI